MATRNENPELWRQQIFKKRLLVPLSNLSEVEDFRLVTNQQHINLDLSYLSAAIYNCSRVSNSMPLEYWTIFASWLFPWSFVFSNIIVSVERYHFLQSRRSDKCSSEFKTREETAPVSKPFRRCLVLLDFARSGTIQTQVSNTAVCDAVLVTRDESQVVNVYLGKLSPDLSCRNRKETTRW
jgi:hypothetical protein